MKRKGIKIAWIAFRALLTVGAAALAAFLLWRFEYFSQFAEIDNIVGMLPVLFAFVFVVALIGALWMKHSREGSDPR